MDDEQISYTETIFSDTNPNFNFTLIKDDDDAITVDENGVLIWKGASPATDIKFIILSTKSRCLRV